MALTVVTDHAAIRDTLDVLVTADPVRNTVFGTMGLALEDTAWAAADGDRFAVRSTADRPLNVTPWPDLAELHEALAALPDLAGVSGPAAEVEALADVLGPDPRLERQRLHRLDELAAPAGVAGRVVVADAAYRDVGRAWFAAFVDETEDSLRGTDAAADSALEQGQLFLWLDADDRPAAMACRRPVLAGSARVGPVYTPPGQRGHGYGSAVTAAATRSILDDGAVPVLFTDLANPTSNRIYAALGYRPVEDRLVAFRRP